MAETPAEHTERLSHTHTPLGMHGLWGVAHDHLPDYQENVAKAIMARGVDESEAIAIARSRIDAWQHSTNPAVMKASRADHAAWTHLKAKHQHPDEDEGKR